MEQLSHEESIDDFHHVPPGTSQFNLMISVPRLGFASWADYELRPLAEARHIAGKQETQGIGSTW